MKQYPLACRASLSGAGVAVALWLAAMALAVQPSGAAFAADARDAATIAELQARIDALERRLAELEQAGKHERAVSPPLSSGPLPERSPAPASTASSPSGPQSMTAAPADQASAPATEATTEATADATGMERALERALVREGGLLLPPAAIEIEPRWSYQHHASSALELLSADGTPQLAHVARRRDLQQAALGLRVGLPAQLQLDLLLPYARVRERNAVVGAGASSESLSGWGAGEIGLSWQLRSAAAGAGIVAGLRWIEPASSSIARDGAASVVGGFRAWQASLLFVTRRDPVVFFGALSHAARRPQQVAGHALDPGNAIGLRTGAIIALSPDTSLRMGLDLLRSGSTRIDGVINRGSSHVSGEFSTGFSFVLSPRVLLGVEAAVGLTQTSPDFRIGLSLPVRF